MIYVRNLIEGLQELSDERFQERVWPASGWPESSSFEELVAQIFDDTGLSDALDSGKCPPELDSQAFSALKDLGRAISKVQSVPPGMLLSDLKVERVRKTAAHALDLVRKGQTL